MKIEKILENIYIEKYNVVGIILENRIVTNATSRNFLDYEGCMAHIKKYKAGLVQTSESFKEAKLSGRETAIKTDPLEVYKTMYEELTSYARLKFEDFTG